MLKHHIFIPAILIVVIVFWALPALAEMIVDTAWVRRYNGPGDSLDRAYAIAVDVYGNVYVTGSSYSGGTDYDYATIKYYPEGDTAWIRKYSGPGNSGDNASAIAVDGNGNVYVTGDSWGSGTSYDYATIKYHPNGDTAWVRRYNGTGNYGDGARAIAVDGFNNVYVTGWSWGDGTWMDYATIKYYPNGDIAWVKRYNGPASFDDRVSALAVDASNRVYVTGRSWGDETGVDFATVTYDPDGKELWVRRYNGHGDGNDGAFAMAVDDSSNVYLAGYSASGGAYKDDYATIKYSPYLRPRGDANGDRTIDIGDVVYLINYLYKGAPPPNPLEVGNCNCDGVVDLGDVVFLINYLFKEGPPPDC